MFKIFFKTLELLKIWTIWIKVWACTAQIIKSLQKNYLVSMERSKEEELTVTQMMDQANNKTIWELFKTLTNIRKEMQVETTGILFRCIIKTWVPNTSTVIAHLVITVTIAWLHQKLEEAKDNIFCPLMEQWMDFMD